MNLFADVSHEYSKDKDLKKEDVDNLIYWVDKQPHLPKISELQSILFLQSCYYSNEKAKNAIEIFFTMRTACKELFRNSDINDSGIKMASGVAIIHMLPKCGPDGHKIIFMRLLDTDVDKYFFVDHLRMFDMVITLKMHIEGTNQGVNLVFDLQGVSFSHLIRLNPVLVHKYLYYLQESLPIRLKEIHLVNAPAWIDKALMFFKPFLKKELYESIRVFTDFDSFFEVIPKEYLPSDYGGEDVDSIEALAEKTRKTLRDHADFFEDQARQLTDESKRMEKVEDYNNMFGVEGTFRKLCLD